MCKTHIFKLFVSECIAKVKNLGLKHQQSLKTLRRQGFVKTFSPPHLHSRKIIIMPMAGAVSPSAAATKAGHAH